MVCQPPHAPLDRTGRRGTNSRNQSGRDGAEWDDRESENDKQLANYDNPQYSNWGLLPKLRGVNSSGRARSVGSRRCPRPPVSSGNQRKTISLANTDVVDHEVGVSPGQVLTSPDQLAEMMSEILRRMQADPEQFGRKRKVAASTWSHPPERQLGDSAIQNTSKIEAVGGPRSSAATASSSTVRPWSPVPTPHSWLGGSSRCKARVWPPSASWSTPSRPPSHSARTSCAPFSATPLLFGASSGSNVLN